MTHSYVSSILFSIVSIWNLSYRCLILSAFNIIFNLRRLFGKKYDFFVDIPHFHDGNLSPFHHFSYFCIFSKSHFFNFEQGKLTLFENTWSTKQLQVGVMILTKLRLIHLWRNLLLKWRFKMGDFESFWVIFYHSGSFWVILVHSGYVLRYNLTILNYNWSFLGISGSCMVGLLSWVWERNRI